MPLEQMANERHILTSILKNIRTSLALAAALFVVLLSSCSEIQKPKAEPFYAESTPPAKQEFRWTNGKTPKSFDPARAAAAPETDIVRAIFEGLTETDSRTLQETPAAAEKWVSSEGGRIWTFHLRKNARWSNGERVTASDFVSSWKRLALLGDKAAHPELFQNIIGLRIEKPAAVGTTSEPQDFIHSGASISGPQLKNEQSNSVAAMKPQAAAPPLQNANSSEITPPEKKAPAAKPKAEKFGAEAVDDFTLRVSLEFPDKDFPKLVANPVFRPVYGDGSEFENAPLSAGVVTNGAFKVTGTGRDGIVLDRSQTYWNSSSIALDSVRFVAHENAEAALDSYKKGEVDAVTNAEFEPLVLKLLAPYDDFRQTTHSALNFYEFNTKNQPFSDRRIREALAISIDRERLTVGELESSAQPALSFLPLGDKKNAKLLLDVEKAKQLFEKAGFPGGEGFPKVRLIINRNDTQQRVARLIAKMWKQNLNLDTEISVKESIDLEAMRVSGEYDLIRRGIVLPTADETVSMAAIFGISKMPEPAAAKEQERLAAAPPAVPDADDAATDKLPRAEHPEVEQDVNNVVSEATAVYELNAIPLYFPMSYSLVKPYVKGFEMNGLDAPMLQNISIDSSWQPMAGTR